MDKEGNIFNGFTEIPKPEKKELFKPKQVTEDVFNLGLEQIKDVLEVKHKTVIQELRKTEEALIEIYRLELKIEGVKRKGMMVEYYQMEDGSVVPMFKIRGEMGFTGGQNEGA